MPKAVSTEAGMHRWVWDLHFPAPVSVRHEFPISAVPGDTPRVPQGPRAVPGEYSVRLTADGKTLTTSLTLNKDPRVKASQADLEQQFKLQTRLASMMTRSSEAILQARSIREQLEKLSASATSSTKEAIAALDKKIVTLLEPAGASAAATSEEKNLKDVNGDVYDLYMQVDHPDAAPTLAQEKATEATEAELAPLLKRWQEIKSSDMPALNRLLKTAQLSEIQVAIDPNLEEEPAEDLE